MQHATLPMKALLKDIMVDPSVALVDVSITFPLGQQPLSTNAKEHSLNIQTDVILEELAFL